MEEQQSLLGRGARLSASLLMSSDLPPPTAYGEPSSHLAGSSSEGSDSSWEDYHSTCSSCSGSDSSEEEWEELVAENGELLFIQPSKSTSEAKHNFLGEADEFSPIVTEAVVPSAKSILDKRGKFVRWIRRRESKRLRPRLSAVGSSLKADRNTLVTVSVKLSSPDKTGPAALGLELTQEHGKFFVKSVQSDGLFADSHKINSGDMLKTINGEEVSMEVLEKLKAPSQVTLRLQKIKETPGKSAGNESSRLLQTVLEGDKLLQGGLQAGAVPCAVVVVNIGELSDDRADSDLVFSFPAQSQLLAARGAFLTLNHLLPSIAGSECKSCTCEVGDEKTHVVFYNEDDLLLLLSMPDRICRSEELALLLADLLRCISFSHQTLQCCFRKDRAVVEKFFSGFFARTLSVTGVPGIDSLNHHFHDFLPEAAWVPLPKEAQLQLDDALNELEACDLSVKGDSMQSDRQFIILGSCLFHQGFLLVSHLPKHDLMDVYSFLRVNGILELSRKDGVARMVVWRQVFPSSVNRGLPPAALTSTAYTPPLGRWFILIVSTGHDVLVSILENAGCCIPLPSTVTPNVHLVRESEDTLDHIQGLGLTNLASHWLALRNRPVTTTSRRMHKSTLSRTPVAAVLPRVSHGQEDTFSQAPSNLSNPSNASECDENAPILGRRAERSGLAFTAAPTASMAAVRELSDDSQSDSSDSDSDWGSFKGIGEHDNGSGLFDNPYLPSNVGDLCEITPMKITSGGENQLLHFVCVDGNEGVVVTSAAPTASLLAAFTRAAHSIHAQLQHNVRFRALPDPRGSGLSSRSLSVVKECAVLIHAHGEKPHWVVGRIFFTPKPREVYVCYRDDAPQNMLEMAFRLGLGMSG